MVKVAVITLGCPKNIADTESVIAEFSAGFQLSNLSGADIVIINSCAFLKVARDEVYENIEAIREKRIVLIGCLTTQLKKDFFDQYPQVKAIVSPVNYGRIDGILKRVVKGETVFCVDPEPDRFTDMPGKFLITPPGFSYVKIAEGCNNGCAFCLIPRLRGNYRSRPMQSIISEIRQLVKIGIKEIVLVAQDTGFYGADLYKRKALPELLKKIISIKGDFWVRLLYVYPERITDELLKIVASSDKICKYLDMPLQHGDPDILKAMRRPYDMKLLSEKIAKIRKMVPCIALRTSMIAGFPGETKKQFKNLLKFIKDINFDHVGVFKYSREPGTPAHSFKGQVSSPEKDKRRGEAMLLQQKISLKKNQAIVGTVCRVLVEDFDDERGAYIGRSAKFAPEVDGKVYIKSAKKLRLNEFADVKITGASEYDLIAEAI
ncbi:30S ribosomal protein S12 methylthiotransferase RimO [Patescibacteria group bacterium]|nr:30S ribosomal protein S12 methylthiotransferase RimO [Patescibacteria group bacterium]MBU1015637.1 30S ribosomal protein S12 methylthiotransferase RimO [Patescibacteria group bacterium]MBU1684788.1 30S ribosomal protein S12 methylthiotransferase RimO [Patescibacteria group bacterium]MBU1938222.1 30S ribosomal protein S12 methylthiotransferase RimO [Patescibacteria group bacterium]